MLTSKSNTELFLGLLNSQVEVERMQLVTILGKRWGEIFETVARCEQAEERKAKLATFGEETKMEYELLHALSANKSKRFMVNALNALENRIPEKAESQGKSGALYFPLTLPSPFVQIISPRDTLFAHIVSLEFNDFIFFRILGNGPIFYMLWLCQFLGSMFMVLSLCSIIPEIWSLGSLLALPSSLCLFGLYNVIVLLQLIKEWETAIFAMFTVSMTACFIDMVRNEPLRIVSVAVLFLNSSMTMLSDARPPRKKKVLVYNLVYLNVCVFNAAFIFLYGSGTWTGYNQSVLVLPFGRLQFHVDSFGMTCCSTLFLLTLKYTMFALQSHEVHPLIVMRGWISLRSIRRGDAKASHDVPEGRVSLTSSSYSNPTVVIESSKRVVNMPEQVIPSDALGGSNVFTPEQNSNARIISMKKVSPAELLKRGDLTRGVSFAIMETLKELLLAMIQSGDAAERSAVGAKITKRMQRNLQVAVSAGSNAVHIDGSENRKRKLQNWAEKLWLEFELQAAAMSKYSKSAPATNVNMVFHALQPGNNEGSPRNINSSRLTKGTSLYFPHVIPSEFSQLIDPRDTVARKLFGRRANTWAFYLLMQHPVTFRLILLSAAIGWTMMVLSLCYLVPAQYSFLSFLQLPMLVTNGVLSNRQLLKALFVEWDAHVLLILSLATTISFAFMCSNEPLRIVSVVFLLLTLCSLVFSDARPPMKRRFLGVRMIYTLACIIFISILILYFSGVWDGYENTIWRVSYLKFHVPSFGIASLVTLTVLSIKTAVALWVSEENNLLIVIRANLSLRLVEGDKLDDDDSGLQRGVVISPASCSAMLRSALFKSIKIFPRSCAPPLSQIYHQ